MHMKWKKLALTFSLALVMVTLSNVPGLAAEPTPATLSQSVEASALNIAEIGWPTTYVKKPGKQISQTLKGGSVGASISPKSTQSVYFKPMGSFYGNPNQIKPRPVLLHYLENGDLFCLLLIGNGKPYDINVRAIQNLTIKTADGTVIAQGNTDLFQEDVIVTEYNDLYGDSLEGTVLEGEGYTLDITNHQSILVIFQKGTFRPDIPLNQNLIATGSVNYAQVTR